MKVITKEPARPAGVHVDKLVAGRLYRVVGGSVVYLATNSKVYRLVEVVNGYIYGPELSGTTQYEEVESAVLNIG